MCKDHKSNLMTTSTSTKANSSKKGPVLSLLVLAQFMVLVDFMIVQVALSVNWKRIWCLDERTAMDSHCIWITLAGFLMLSGLEGDLYGHKKLFIIGVMLFSLASWIKGLAPSEIVLVLARSAQGLGAAMASAAGLSILVTVFPEGRERNRASKYGEGGVKKYYTKFDVAIEVPI